MTSSPGILISGYEFDGDVPTVLACRLAGPWHEFLASPLHLRFMPPSHRSPWEVVEKGKDPVALLGPNIHFAILWVRYDRKIAGRGQNPDVFDYRANMNRQDLDGQGKARPSARINGWIDWGLSDGDDPAELVTALEAVRLTCAAYAA